MRIIMNGHWTFRYLRLGKRRLFCVIDVWEGETIDPVIHPYCASAQI